MGDDFAFPPSSGDIWPCLETFGFSQRCCWHLLETRDAAKLRTRHRTKHHNKDLSNPKCQFYPMNKPALVGPCQVWGVSKLSLFLCPSIWSDINQLCSVLYCWCCLTLAFDNIDSGRLFTFLQFKKLENVKVLHNLTVIPHLHWLMVNVFDCRSVFRVYIECSMHCIIFLKIWKMLCLKYFKPQRFLIRDYEFFKNPYLRICLMIF